MKILWATLGLERSISSIVQLNLDTFPKKRFWAFVAGIALLCLSSLFFFKNTTQKEIYHRIVLSEIFGEADLENETKDSKPLLMNVNQSKEILSKVPREPSYSLQKIGTSFASKRINFLPNIKNIDIEKKLLESLPSSLQKGAKKYIRPVLKLSEIHNVDPIWILSVMWTESHFRSFVRSHAGAHGLMQVMPGTRKFVYKKYRRSGKFLAVELDDFKMSEYFGEIPSSVNKKYILKLVNIEIAILYLKSLLRDFNNSHALATISYNMGPNWTKRRIRRKLPVGNKNIYLNKVTRAYNYITKRFKKYDIVASSSL